MKNAVSTGTVVDYAASADVASGGVVLMVTRIGIAVNNIKAGETGPAQVVGNFSVAKLSSDVVAQGDALYWDNTNKRLTKTASGNTYAGWATAAAGNGVTTVNIKIND